MGVQLQTIAGPADQAAPDVQGPQAPPEAQPWRTLIGLGVLRRNLEARPEDHSRYKLTGLGWTALVGGAWLFLRRRSSSED